MDEGTESATQSGVDIVLNHRYIYANSRPQNGEKTDDGISDKVFTQFYAINRLVETGFGTKNDYMTYLKDYMKKVVKYLEEKGRQVCETID